nr:hypothetical protein [Tanacetum cinerariifolium]
MNEQIARDVEVARIHAEEEIQGMIDSLDKSNETVAKYLQEYQQFPLDLSLEKKIELISNLVKCQDHYKKVYQFQSQQRKPMSKKQKREYYMAEPMEDQPLPADASPTALSPGYVVDSDPEKDEKDPKEDPADYPANKRDNDDDDSSNDDDDDDDVEKDKEEKEEEHLAPADPSDASIDDLVPSS